MTRIVFRIILSLVLSLQVGDIAGQSNYMVVTSSDGRNVSFRMSDIDSVWFTDDDKYDSDDDVLKILAIGNSFTEDGTEYLSTILNNAGIPTDKLIVCRYILGGSSLKTWSELADNNGTAKTYVMFGSEKPYEYHQSYNIQDVMEYDWDIVVLQQLSGSYYDLTTYEPYLTNLMSYVRRHVKGYPRLAWQMTWSRSSSAGDGDIYGLTGWENNATATKYLMENYVFDILIPSGTAMQNMRQTAECDSAEFTRDGQHAGYGVGRYLVAMTWYASLIAPYFNKNIYDINCLYEVKDYEKSWSTNETKDVDENNLPLIKDCVNKAILSPFKLNTTN